MKKLSTTTKWLAIAGFTGILYLAGGGVRAQSTQPETKKMKVKIFQNINGVETMRDTVIEVSGLEALPDLSVLRNKIVPVSPATGNEQELLRQALKANGQTIEVKEIEKLLKDVEGKEKIQVRVLKNGSGDRLNIDSLLKNRQIRVEKFRELEGELKAVKFTMDGDALKNLEGKKGMEFITKTGDSLLVFKQIFIVQHDLTGDEKKLLETKAKEKTAAGKIKDLNLETVNIYPNPNNGTFRISFNAPKKGPTSVALMDQAGKELFREELGNFSGTYEKEINLHNQPKGIYFLQVMQGKQVYNKKVVVQ